MALDWATIGVSVAGSLAVSYIGVRYFTPYGIRAQHSEQARRELRDQVAIPLREARAFLGANEPRREPNVTYPDDAVAALYVLKCARDMYPARRWLVLRRCRRVFGRAWTDLAAENTDTGLADLNDFATRAVVRGLFTEASPGEGVRILGLGAPRVKYSDGLVQRAYVAGPRSSEARQLVAELTKLQRGY